MYIYIYIFNIHESFETEVVFRFAGYARLAVVATKSMLRHMFAQHGFRCFKAPWSKVVSPKFWEGKVAFEDLNHTFFCDMANFTQVFMENI